MVAQAAPAVSPSLTSLAAQLAVVSSSSLPLPLVVDLRFSRAVDGRLNYSIPSQSLMAVLGLATEVLVL